MKVLIRRASIVCPHSTLHGQTKDILTDGETILTIQDTINDAADQVIEAENLYVSVGWVDCFAHFTDPGLEHRETLETGAASAAAGGFTDVLVIPNTAPALHNKAQIEYIVQRSRHLPVNIIPIGAVTKDCAGKELAEMYDMRLSGALAFGDGIQTIQSSGLLLKALQYVKAFDGTVIQVPDDNSIGSKGLMNEGLASTRLGLPGKPALAEELMVARDIKLARYADSKLHFTGVSSAKSLEYIRRAKEAGIAITCSVTPYHLYYTDEDLAQYDTNLKVNPPLRTATDKAALLQALAEGTVDCIASHHLPQHSDNKDCEFEYAKNGMAALQNSFAVANTLLAQQYMSTEAIVEKFATRPRQVFDLAMPTIAEGEAACLTLFDPVAAVTVQKSDLLSKSVNNPFIGCPLKGKILGIIQNKQFTRF
jgi:dihydroorotase